MSRPPVRQDRQAQRPQRRDQREQARVEYRAHAKIDQRMAARLRKADYDLAPLTACAKGGASARMRRRDMDGQDFTRLDALPLERAADSRRHEIGIAGIVDML